MAETQSRLIVREEGEIARVQFQDRNILDEGSIQEIGREISQMIDRSGNPKILIDFANVEHLSSAALGTLITVNNKVKEKGGQLRLANIDAQIYEVFVITKLNKLFKIYDNAEEASTSFT
ncbi:MAG: anti-anti-sigma factor [Phycisphaeraceae bacterium]|nr:anti-anti-sigma factor [Phycisphaeraceae bacterium]